MFVEIDFRLKLRAPLLFFDKLGHDFFDFSQLLPELHLIDILLFPQNAVDKHVLHLPLTNT